MGYYIDQLAEQDRKRRLSELLSSEGEDFTVTQAPPQGNTLADIIRNPNQNWSQETKDALNAYNARLSNSSISSRGINPNFMAGEPYMPPQQQQLQQQPQAAQGDFGQVPVDTPYGRGRYMKGDNTRVVLDNGRVVDLGRDTGRERALMKEDLGLQKMRAEIDQMRAKPHGDTDIQKQINLMRMYESIPDPKMKQAFGEKHGFAGKPLVEEKPMTAAQRAKFEEGFANDYQTVNQTVSTMGEIKGAIDNIRGSKGLDYREGLSGYISPILQGENARTAENRINTLKGKVTQMGKAMASMAGAIGPMAVQEWKIVSDAVNAIDPTAGNFKEQLANIESQADGAINRIKDKYERQYVDRFEKYPQFRREGSSAQPKSPASPTPAADPGYEAWKKRNGKS